MQVSKDEFNHLRMELFSGRDPQNLTNKMDQRAEELDEPILHRIPINCNPRSGGCKRVRPGRLKKKHG